MCRGINMDGCRAGSDVSNERLTNAPCGKLSLAGSRLFNNMAIVVVTFQIQVRLLLTVRELKGCVVGVGGL